MVSGSLHEGVRGRRGGIYYAQERGGGAGLENRPGKGATGGQGGGGGTGWYKKRWKPRNFRAGWGKDAAMPAKGAPGALKGDFLACAEGSLLVVTCLKPQLPTHSNGSIPGHTVLKPTHFHADSACGLVWKEARAPSIYQHLFY